MQNNQHITMFKPFDNEAGYIHCVVSGANKGNFEGLGFVDSIDKIVSPNEELDRLVELRDKAKALKIRGWQKMSEDTLIKKIKEAE